MRTVAQRDSMCTKTPKPKIFSLLRGNKTRVLRLCLKRIPKDVQSEQSSICHVSHTVTAGAGYMWINVTYVHQFYIQADGCW